MRINFILILWIAYGVVTTINKLFDELVAMPPRQVKGDAGYADAVYAKHNIMKLTGWLVVFTLLFGVICTDTAHTVSEIDAGRLEARVTKYGNVSYANVTPKLASQTAELASQTAGVTKEGVPDADSGRLSN